jgi:glycosyltransferase involved in cell wall biosynthesis
MTELLYEKVTKPAAVDDYAFCPSLKKRICVVLTAYDDEEAIGDAIKEFKSQRNVVNVIVVDNNCKDDTSLVARNAGAEVVSETSQGYGYACVRGLREALCCSNAEVIVLAEGDMTFRGRDVWKLLPFLEDADFVVGSRTHMHFTDSDSQMDWFYLWGNMFIAKVLQLRFFNWRFMGVTRFSDVGCTMRAISKRGLLRIIDDLEVGDGHFSPHMLKVALQNHLRVVEVPITFRKRVGVSKGAGGSKWTGIKIGLRMLWHIIT